jgi:uncharacterized protein
MKHLRLILTCFSLAITGAVTSASAQTAPSQSEVAEYTGLHKAAHIGDAVAIHKLLSKGANLEAQDRAGRTALHVAAFGKKRDAIRALAKAGANLNALENRAYDVVTIAAVANDIKTLDLVLSLGAKATNITSPYDGTALIAAAHLGHHEVVKRLIAAKAPLDHVNNLGWTALIEAVVLGDGGPNHVKCASALVRAGADKSIGDRQGVTPLAHARGRGFKKMVAVLEAPHRD